MENIIERILIYANSNDIKILNSLKFKPVKTVLTKRSHIKNTPKNLIIHVNCVSYLDGGFKRQYPLNFGETLILRGRVFQLISMIEHLGVSSFGHYLCYRKFYDKWLKCNDSKVRFVSKEQVFNVANPYMLFYRHCG